MIFPICCIFECVSKTTQADVFYAIRLNEPLTLFCILNPKQVPVDGVANALGPLLLALLALCRRDQNQLKEARHELFLNFFYLNAFRQILGSWYHKQVTLKYWNNAFWLFKRSHLTIFNQFRPTKVNLI